jgi:hypothetical protein
MNRLNSFTVLTMIFGTLFIALAFGLTIVNSSVDSPGGSLPSVLGVQPIFQWPMIIIGGLFVIFVFASFAAYTQVKRQPQM